MHLNPYAPVYFPQSHSLPPPPPPPLPQLHTYICYFPPRAPYPFIPYAGSPIPATQPDEKKERLVWLPKESFERTSKFLSAFPVAPAPPLKATAPTHLDFRTAAPDLLVNGTTIMIKNLPNKLTRELLIQMLDEHCAGEKKAISKVHEHEENNCVKSEFDFVYLPIDFSTRANKGYAFVNFTTAEAARKAYNDMHHRKWVIFKSKKVARVCFARVQGKTALESRFKCTQFRCDTDEFLPATFTPPRNGTTSLTPPNTVGRRITHLPLIN